MGHTYLQREVVHPSVKGIKPDIMVNLLYLVE